MTTGNLRSLQQREFLPRNSLKAPHISVIIPTYNHADYVGFAIESALGQQTKASVEIIVVDDGSTDDTNVVAAKYGERIRYIWQANRGLSGARNTGILAAQGKYIALLDADDFWQPDFLEAVFTYLEQHPNVGAVHSGLQFVDKQGHPLPQDSIVTVPADAMYDRLLDGEFFAADAVLVRRECFDKVGLFDEAFRASEDWDMWLRVAKAYHFAGIPKALLNYRMHGDNMSADPLYMLDYQLKVLEKHFGTPLGEPSTWPLDQQRAYGIVYYQVAQGFFLKQDQQAGRKYLALAFETNPALTQSLNLYYELGCADQPLGERNATTLTNLEANASQLLSNLAAIFDRNDLSARLRKQKATAHGHAFMALGLLAYNGQQFDLARTYLWYAINSHFGLLWQKRQLLPMLCRSWLKPLLQL